MEVEILFRNEHFRESYVRDIKQIMMFEMFELRNIDIPNTLNRTIFKGYEDAYMYTAHIIEIIEEYDQDDLSDQFKLDTVESLLKMIKKYTGTDLRYALWLTSMDAVKKLYCEGASRPEDGMIDGYIIGPVMLSDIGEDGKLFGYETNPETVWRGSIDDEGGAENACS